METARDFILGGSKIPADVEVSFEIKRHLLFGRKIMTNLDSILKGRDIALLTKVFLVKAMVLPVAMYGYKSWTINKAEHQRTDAFELWCWRRLMRVTWTVRRSNQSILMEISPEYSLEGLMLMLKLQYFGHLMQRSASLERTLMLGKIEGKRRKGWQMMRSLNDITDSMDTSLSNVWELVMERETWHAVVHGVTKSWTRLRDWTEGSNFIILHENIQFSDTICWRLSFLHWVCLVHSLKSIWTYLQEFTSGLSILVYWPLLFFLPFHWNIVDLHYCINFKGCCFCSVTKLCLTLCNLTDYSMLGFPALNYLLEFTQTHAYWVGDAIQHSHSLSPPYTHILNPSQNQSLSNKLTLSIRWPKYWSFSFSIGPSGLISFRMDWFDLLAVQGTCKSLLQHHSSKTSILQHPAFFMAQLSRSYMATGKITSFTRWSFVSKMILCFLFFIFLI